MEKITDRSKIDRKLSNCLRTAMASLAVSEPDKIYFPQPGESENNNGISNSNRGFRMHPIHGHANPEIAICIGGNALMELEHGPLNMSYPSVIAFGPHVKHCQAAPEDGAQHALLWLIFSKNSMLVSNIIYQPKNRWPGTEKFSRTGESIENLKDNISSGLYLKQQNGKERFRVELLDILNQSFQQVARNDLSGAQENTSNTVPHAPLIKYIASFIEDNLQEYITLKFLGQVARLSPNHLNSLFKRHFGITIHSYLIKCRMGKAMELLRNGNLKAKQVALKVGYSDPLYFSRAFHKYYGFWPSEVDS